MATIKRYMVLIKKLADGKTTYVRRPYDVVEYDKGSGEKKTYLQPHYGRTQSVEERAEEYDDIKIYDTRPDWDICNTP